MGDRLLWQCRRGMRELDKVVEGYYLHHYADGNDIVQAAFRDLLEEADPEILAWVTQREPAPERYNAILVIMRTLGHLPART
jgi:antitoxin CptB